MKKYKNLIACFVICFACCVQPAIADIFDIIQVGNDNALRQEIQKNPGAISLRQDRGRSTQLTPLHFAAYLGRSQMVLALLVAGADPGLTDGEGMTPLHMTGMAVTTIDILDCADYLLKYGADINAVDKQGRTPLGWAKALSRDTMVGYLEDRGAR